MKYLVDTDLIVDGVAGIGSAVAPFERHAHDGLAVSIISLGELYEGAYGAANPESHFVNLRVFLTGWTVLGLDGDIMHRFAQERYRLRRQGNLIPDLDLLIAATALHHDLTLMTRNVRHFSRIPNVKLYQPSERGG